jgi:hypothetical protein
MNKNMGGLDRVVRAVIGVVLLGLAATGTVGMWGYLGIVPLATAAIGWCPAYLPFGFSSCRNKNV